MTWWKGQLGKELRGAQTRQPGKSFLLLARKRTSVSREINFSDGKKILFPHVIFPLSFQQGFVISWMETGVFSCANSGCF